MTTQNDKLLENQRQLEKMFSGSPYKYLKQDIAKVNFREEKNGNKKITGEYQLTMSDGGKKSKIFYRVVYTLREGNLDKVISKLTEKRDEQINELVDIIDMTDNFDLFYKALRYSGVDSHENKIIPKSNVTRMLIQLILSEEFRKRKFKDSLVDMFSCYNKDNKFQKIICTAVKSKSDTIVEVYLSAVFRNDKIAAPYEESRTQSIRILQKDIEISRFTSEKAKKALMNDIYKEINIRAKDVSDSIIKVFDDIDSATKKTIIRTYNNRKVADRIFEFERILAEAGFANVNRPINIPIYDENKNRIDCTATVRINYFETKFWEINVALEIEFSNTIPCMRFHIGKDYYYSYHRSNEELYSYSLERDFKKIIYYLLSGEFKFYTKTIKDPDKQKYLNCPLYNFVKNIPNIDTLSAEAYKDIYIGADINDPNSNRLYLYTRN